MTKIIPFYNGPFCQWYTSPIIINGINYSCCEQYMMAQKAKVFNDFDSYSKIMQNPSPRDQKALGKLVKNFDESIWKECREKIVFDGNLAKFTQNPKLKQYLLNTKNAIICEASPYDKIWGIGLAENDPRVHDQKQWDGLNLLGKVIMEVRNQLK